MLPGLLALSSLAVVLGSLADVVETQRQINALIAEMRNTVLNLAYESTSKEVESLEELKSLKTELQNVEAALALAEEYADKKVELENFDEARAEATLQRMLKLAEQQETLENKVLHAHDLELYEKLEEALASFSKSKQAVQQQMLVVKARVAEIETIIRKDSRFFWAYLLVGGVCLAAFLSYRAVTKKP